jgi:ATP-binding cassette subfamily B multidrug efflux pump
MNNRGGQAERSQGQRPHLGVGGRGHGPGMMAGAIETPKSVRGALSRLLRYLGSYRIYLVLTLVLTVVSTLLSLAGPYFIGVAIDQYLIPNDLEGLAQIALLIAAIYLVGMVIDMGTGWVMATISQQTLKQLRKDLFEHTQTLSLRFFDHTSTGDLMSRLTNDIDAIGTLFAQNVTGLVRDLFTLMGIVVAMFRLNTTLALASLVAFPIMVGMITVVGKRTRLSFRTLQQNMGRLNGVMQETLTGQKVIIAFAQQESTNTKFRKTNNEVKATGIRAETYSMMVPPLMFAFNNLNIAIVAGLGSWMTLQGLATVGTISVFITYSRQFSTPLRQFGHLYNTIQSALAGAERVFEILDTQPEAEDAPDALPVDRFKGEVIFSEVDFSYEPKVPVLKNVSLEAQPGQVIAIVGPTGAGKTTSMINLLSRFYDVSDGVICIDGHNIQQIRKDDLRGQLGIVLQDVFIFSGTVMDNIRYGRLEATDDECIEAAKIANADGFIRQLPQGYQTNLSEGAANLSQGQRQLLSIARAIVANPSILILDEATSSVDTRTEIQIQEAMRRLMTGRTTFIIAHRLSTIRNAHQIFVINEGEIIERGTHNELMTAKGFYYDLYMSQFKGTYNMNQPRDEAPFGRQAASQVPGRGRGMQAGPGMMDRGGGGGMGGRSMEPRFEAVRNKMTEFQRLLQEKEAAGYDVNDCNELAQSARTAMREEDVEAAAKRINEAMERLKALNKRGA